MQGGLPTNPHQQQQGGQQQQPEPSHGCAVAPRARSCEPISSPSHQPASSADPAAVMPARKCSWLLVQMPRQQSCLPAAQAVTSRVCNSTLSNEVYMHYMTCHKEPRSQVRCETLTGPPTSPVAFGSERTKRACRHGFALKMRLLQMPKFAGPKGNVGCACSAALARPRDQCRESGADRGNAKQLRRTDADADSDTLQSTQTKSVGTGLLTRGAKQPQHLAWLSAWQVRCAIGACVHTLKRVARAKRVRSVAASACSRPTGTPAWCVPTTRGW